MWSSIAVCGKLVSLQIGRLVEELATLVATVRFLPSVYINVHLQI